MARLNAQALANLVNGIAVARDMQKQAAAGKQMSGDWEAALDEAIARLQKELPLTVAIAGEAALPSTT